MITRLQAQNISIISRPQGTAALLAGLALQVAVEDLSAGCRYLQVAYTGSFWCPWAFYLLPGEAKSYWLAVQK